VSSYFPLYFVCNALPWLSQSQLRLSDKVVLRDLVRIQFSMLRGGPLVGIDVDFKEENCLPIVRHVRRGLRHVGESEIQLILGHIKDHQISYGLVVVLRVSIDLMEPVGEI